MQAPPRLLTRILHSDHKEVISPNDPAQVRRLQCSSLSQLPLNPNPESAFQETRKDFFFDVAGGHKTQASSPHAPDLLPGGFTLLASSAVIWGDAAQVAAWVTSHQPEEW